MNDDAPPIVSLLLESCVGAALESITRLPNGVIVASPYLTSDVAETMIRACEPATATVITTFRADIFAAGGSSLQTLRALVEGGFNVRYLDGLHAKLIVTEADCYVGSQNLTAGGTRNKEATAVVSHIATAEGLGEKLRTWIEESKPISLSMLDEMEHRLPLLRQQFTELAATAKLVDNDVRHTEANRLERIHADKIARQQRAKAAREKQLLKAAYEAHTGLRAAVHDYDTTNGVPLRLQRVDNWEWSTSSSYWTMKGPIGVDLTRWRFDSEGAEHLTKRERYLLVMPDSGKLGWPALNKTQLTYFGQVLEPSNAVLSMGRRHWVLSRIDLNDDLRTLPEWNVRFALRPKNDSEKFNVLMKFTIDELLFVRLEGQGEQSASRDILMNAISNQIAILPLIRQLLSPFRYRTNRRGGESVDASEFCEGMGDDFTLRLHRHGFRHFFSLEKR